MDASGFDMTQMLPSALVAGPVFGIVAVLFMLAIRYSARFAATSGWSPAKLLVTAAIITGLVGTAFPEVLGLGTGPLAHMLEGGFEIEFLAILLVLKLVLTALCIGFGMFGGVFSPALLLGLLRVLFAAGSCRAWHNRCGANIVHLWNGGGGQCRYRCAGFWRCDYS